MCAEINIEFQLQDSTNSPKIIQQRKVEDPGKGRTCIWVYGAKYEQTLCEVYRNGACFRVCRAGQPDL